MALRTMKIAVIAMNIKIKHKKIKKIEHNPNQKNKIDQKNQKNRTTMK